MSSSYDNRPVWGEREVGEFTPVPTSYGYTMPNRPYDQSTAVVSMEDGTATFRNKHAFDGQRRVLYEQQLPFGTLPVALEKLEPVDQRFDSVAYLSNTSPENFYHWFLLVLPFLRFYKAAGVEAEKYYVGKELNSWQKRSLDFVGLREDQLLSRPCSADVAHVAVATRWINGVPPAQVLWARSKFVPVEPEIGERRLFVGRGSNSQNRALLDEEKIATALEREFGVEYVTTSGMTLDDELDLFGQASAVIAPFGAAMTNILFAPRGIKVLELAPFDNDFSIAQCYQELSSILGNSHGVLRGHPTPRKRRGLQSHIKVDLDDVLRETDKMLSE